MIEFKIAVNSYKNMRKFTKILADNGIEFKNSMHGQLAIEVAENDVEIFLQLANTNNIQFCK